MIINETLTLFGAVELGDGRTLRLALETTPAGPTMVLRIFTGEAPGQGLSLPRNAVHDLHAAAAQAVEWLDADDQRHGAELRARVDALEARAVAALAAEASQGGR